MPEFCNPFAVLKNDRNLTHQELVRAIRFMIAAEYEAIQLYQQVAESTDHALAKEEPDGLAVVFLGQLFHDENRREEVRSSAAVRLRDLHGHDAQLEQLAHHRAVHLLGGVHCHGLGRDLGSGEIPHGFLEHAFLFGQRGERGMDVGENRRHETSGAGFVFVR